MPKGISTGMQDHLELDNTTLAKFIKIKRSDNVIFGFSEYDQTITYNLEDGDGLVTYRASNAYSASAIKQKGDIGIDNLNIFGHLESSSITISDLRAGVWDDAEYKIFDLNYNDTSSTGIRETPLGRGHFGKVVTKDDGYAVELLSLMNRYNKEIVNVYTAACRVDLGSTGECSVRMEPVIWSSGSTVGIREDRDAATGTVVRPSTFNDRHFQSDTTGVTGTPEPTWNLSIGGITADNGISWETIRANTIEVTVDAVTDNSNFTIVYSGDAPNSFLTQGLVVWSTGTNNSGRKMEVLTWLSSISAIKLFTPMASTISTGESLKIKAGCNKTILVCSSVFDNVENYRGFAHIPGLDRLFLIPVPPG